MAHQLRIPPNIQTVQSEHLDGLIRRRDQGTNPQHSGGYSDIFIGVYRKDGYQDIKVAIKVLRIVSDRKEVEKVKTYLIREATVWHRLEHHNILQFYGLASDLGRSGCPALISRYCDNGTIMDFLETQPNPTSRIRFNMIIGVADGLRYLHSNLVVHGDLKPKNILVSDEGRPLLCDFGSSRIITHKGFTTKSKGTVRYQAPELLQSDDAKCSEASDVYALGMTCSEIWTSSPPYPDLATDPTIIMRVLVAQGRPPRPPSTSSVTPLLWNLFENCWKDPPEERLRVINVVDILRSLSTLKM